MSFRIALFSAAAFSLLFGSPAFAVAPLEITEVLVDESGSPYQLIVTGRNFDNGNTIELWLGEIGDPLEIVSMSEQSGYFTVVANLPSGIPNGSYQLVVTTGGGAVRIDNFDGVTIGAEGPPGPPGQDGAQGADGTPGRDGAQGEDGLDGSSCSATDTLEGALISCTDGTSATVLDGSDGVDGLPGVKGDTGDRGPQGSAGADGADGLPGLPGVDGRDGRDLSAELCLLYQLTGNASPASLGCISGQCAVDADCPDGTWCRASAGDTQVMECVPFQLEGQACGGITPVFGVLRCAPALVCEDLTPLISDDPGICSVPAPAEATSGTYNVEPALTYACDTPSGQTLSLNIRYLELVVDGTSITMISNPTLTGGGVQMTGLFAGATIDTSGTAIAGPAVFDFSFAGSFSSANAFAGTLLMTPADLGIGCSGRSFVLQASRAESCNAGGAETRSCSSGAGAGAICELGQQTRICRANGTWESWGSCVGTITAPTAQQCP